MSTQPATPAPTITVTASAHPSHWFDILQLILRLAPLGAAISANFTSPTVATEVTDGVLLGEQVTPIVIQIAGITHA